MRRRKCRKVFKYLITQWKFHETLNQISLTAPQAWHDFFRATAKHLIMHRNSHFHLSPLSEQVQGARAAAVPEPGRLQGCSSTSWPGRWDHAGQTPAPSWEGKLHAHKLKTPGSGNPGAPLWKTSQTGLAWSPRLNGDKWIVKKQMTQLHAKPPVTQSSRWEHLFDTAWTVFSSKNYLHTNNRC